MVLLLHKLQRLFLFGCITFALTLTAGYQDPVSLVINNVRSTADITDEMPFNRHFDLQVRFAKGVLSQARTQILTEAFADERASRIVRLDLIGNRLTQSPVVTGLHGLEELHLDNNSLERPPVLTGLTRLRWLFLNNNQLVNPPVLTGLVNLSYLDLSHNRLTEPPVLNGLADLSVLHLAQNFLVRPVILPLVIANKVRLDQIGAPYLIDNQAPTATGTSLVDIARAGDDRVPFFTALETLNRLPLPKRNPLTRGLIAQTRNVVDSWRYWREQGMSQEAFDDRLRQMEPVMLEENMYTVSPALADAFMQERGLSRARITEILGQFADEVNLTELLNLMYPEALRQEALADNEPSAKRRLIE